MEFAFEGALLLCSTIYDNAVSASNNICQCQDLADHVQGIKRILRGIQEDVIATRNGNAPQSLLHSLEYLKGALDRANDVIERYGKRGRILRYVMASKVKDEFEGAFQQIDSALQQLGAINMQLNAESRRQLNELSGRVHQMSYNLTQDMKFINQNINLIFQQQQQQQRSEISNELNSQVKEIIFQIPGEYTQDEQQHDIEDLEAELQIAIAEKNQLEAFMIEQIIAVIQEQKFYQLSKVPSEFICPITQQVMTDPVIVTQTGQTYEKSAIEHWFQRGNNHDPCTHIKIGETPNLIKNYAIKRSIDKYNQQTKTNKDVEMGAQKINNGEIKGKKNNFQLHKSWPLWVWVSVNVIIVCIMAAVITAILVVRNNNQSSPYQQYQQQDIVLSTIGQNLPPCSSEIDRLECDKNVLRKINNRVGDPCQEWGNIFCTTRVHKIFQPFYNIPLELSRLDGLQVLDLNASDFKGEKLPPEWSELTSLIEFRAKDVILSGSLPPEYSTWSNIKFLSAGGDFLLGSIPKQYSNWKNIQDLSYRQNEFSGSLSPQFSTWTALKYLYLFDNFLTGNLPVQFSSWKNIEQIRIENNRFQGTVPEEYSEFQNGNLFQIQNQRGFKNNICIENQSVLIDKFNTENGTGDLDQILQC